jgi:hypothetical protein
MIGSKSPGRCQEPNIKTWGGNLSRTGNPIPEPATFVRTGNLALGYDLSMIGGREVRPWAVYRPIISLTANLRSAFGPF